MVKPPVEERKRVAVIIKEQPEQTEEKKDEEEKEPEKPKMTIIDERNKGFDREALMKRLQENKKLKVSMLPVVKRAEEEEKKEEPIPIIEPPSKKAKKIGEKKKLVIEADEEEEQLEEPKKKSKLIIEDEEQVQEEEPKKKTKLIIEDEEQGEAEKEEPIKIKIGKTEERKTKKVEKGVAVLGPETYVEIGDTAIESRLPKKELPINIRVSSYYMNNREIFINFINSLFEPYRRELQENSENISCDNIGSQSGDFSLLTHQKIVRDYMNLYTPYRGLLLYHGLGSGKTATSIAIAEGMKDGKRIIIMTPASLRTNYIEELKKAGDLLYKKNQYWEWISIEDNPDTLKPISAILNLPMEYIRRKKGAWFVNIKKKTNYSDLSSENKKSLDDQLDEMIRQKYTFINYNGLRAERLKELTSNFTKNLFDNSVVIIDEAHNLISRIVNKIKKEKDIPESDKGEKERLPLSLSAKIYEFLLSAKNARIVLLSGTPVINYPNEFAILFNILRGYIKTWQIPLDVKTSKKVDKNVIAEYLVGEKNLDYLDYSPSSKILTITRNPFGFKNKIKKDSGYQGVSNVKKDDKGVEVIESEYVSDEDFERKIISILKRNDIDVIPNGIKIRNKKALPDKLDEFINRYMSDASGKIKNIESIKRRIVGLSSYFRSAQESLLPRFTKTLGKDYHIVRIQMSDFQFKIYESARREERKMEKPSKKKDDEFEEKTSTYRIFSRLYCNYVMEDRPTPKLAKSAKGDEHGGLENLLKQAEKEELKQDLTDQQEGEIEGDNVLDKIGGIDYKTILAARLADIEKNSNDYLTPEALQTYSPKFLHMLENIQDPEYIGLHLVYSQFRTMEGVGIFSLVLEKNGFARFRIKKNSLGEWKIDIPDQDLGKPTYALYTGTEDAEEKEIIRNIYNGDWQYIPTAIAHELTKIANNNNMGEIIKVLMITSSGSEGINLKNTRYVHIMEPYWHPVRTEQVIGRARRICSHKALPQALQTVEVFLYLMVFSPEQLKSDDAIELKRKDLSKGLPSVPITSDQYLFELSERKANVIMQLTDAIKESAFDCYIYSNGKCLNFGDPNNTSFSYVPDYAEQQSDITIQMNQKKLEWTGKPITLNGVKYVYRRINDQLMNIYDLESYKQALKTSGIQPVQIGTLEINEKGEQVFKQLVT